VLKSKYLDGKRNRRVDHLIHTLVVGMLPSYENKHDRQVLGLEGDNLATKRHKEILARMPEINTESIQDLGDEKFSVQSSTDSSHTYSVELRLQSCDCPDWPRIRLCKHLAAAAHYFGNGDLQIEPAPKTAQPIWEGSLGTQSDAGSAASIVENVIAVSRAFLNDGAPSSPATVRSLQMVESHLTAVVHISRSQEDPLPDKENLPPNQDTWAETAERMGAKRKRRSPPTGSSPEHIMTQQLDDVLVKARLQIHALARESPRGPIKMCAHISRMGPLVMKLPKQSHGPIILSKE